MQENTETVEVVNRNIGRRGTTLFTVGLTLVGAGYLLGMSPVIWAIATTPAGQNPFSEASGGGASMWAMIMTLPAGAVAICIGLLVFAVGLALNLTVKLPARADAPKTRAIAFGRRSRILGFGFSTALFVSGPLLAFVFSNMMFGPAAWDTARVCLGALQVLSIGGAIYYAVRSGKRSVLIVACAVSVLWLITVVVGPSFSPTHLFSF